MIIAALLAIILPLVLIVGLRLPAKIGMTVSAAIVAVVAWAVWRMTPIAMAASVVQAAHRALTIGLILFGAVLLLKTLETTGAMVRIKHGFQSLSGDMRVQTVLVAFAFVSLLEGASGFGTPAIVAAPLLIVLGFSPLAAASLALLGDTVACTFGAVATPLLVGLENVPQYSDALVWLVGAQVAVFDLVIATLLPLGLVSVLVLGFGTQTRTTKLQAIRDIAPWALLIGLVYSVSAFTIVRLIGPEFTAIIAGAITLGVGTWTVRRGIGVPFSRWTTGHDAASRVATNHTTATMPLWRAWLPYGVVVGLLLLTRTVPDVKAAAVSIGDLSLHAIFGVSGIDSIWHVLYSPGIILCVAAISAALVGGRSLRPLAGAGLSAGKTVLTAMLALIPTLILVQIFSNSGHNAAGLAAMPVYIGSTLAATFGHIWPVFAPLLGTIGAFIAGSATVSTLTMGPVQAAIAHDAGLPLMIILALHMIGAAAGNIIAIHNVVAASTVVGLAHQESRIMRVLLLPTISYAALTACIGIVIAIII
ncbi:MAG: L-lactate permease [Candidatus Saccharibacteria bacterium]|nr:L-lactate permease [Candidatus Saccharibacteria bacterium]